MFPGMADRMSKEVRNQNVAMLERRLLHDPRTNVIAQS